MQSEAARGPASDAGQDEMGGGVSLDAEIARLRAELASQESRWVEREMVLLAQAQGAEQNAEAYRVRLETALPDEVCGDTLDRALKAERERDDAMAGAAFERQERMRARGAQETAEALAARYEAALRGLLAAAEDASDHDDACCNSGLDEAMSIARAALSPEPEAK